MWLLAFRFDFDKLPRCLTTSIQSVLGVQGMLLSLNDFYKYSVPEIRLMPPSIMVHAGRTPLLGVAADDRPARCCLLVGLDAPFMQSWCDILCSLLFSLVLHYQTSIKALVSCEPTGLLFCLEMVEPS